SPGGDSWPPSYVDRRFDDCAGRDAALESGNVARMVAPRRLNHDPLAPHSNSLRCEHRGHEQDASEESAELEVEAGGFAEEQVERGGRGAVADDADELNGLGQRQEDEQGTERDRAAQR